MSDLTGPVATCECGADRTAGIQEELQAHQPEVLGQTLQYYEAAHHPCGFTRPAPRGHNTYETRPLIPRTHPGATTTLRRAIWTKNSTGAFWVSENPGFLRQPEVPVVRERRDAPQICSLGLFSHSHFSTCCKLP